MVPFPYHGLVISKNTIFNNKSIAFRVLRLGLSLNHVTDIIFLNNVRSFE